MQESIHSPFNRDTPAEEVVAGINLSGKLAVITGGSTGLGKETARVLAKAGAAVFIGARNHAKLDAAKQELLTGGAQSVSSFTLNLMEPDSVRAFAKAVLELNRPVDMLINNAGIMTCPLARNSLGIESQFATNYLGHALLASMLAPQLIKAGKSRLVSLASSGHHLSPIVFEDINFEQREYNAWKAYGQSKTANVLLAVKAAKHLNAKGVTVTAVHPGVIETELTRYMTEDEKAAAVHNAKVSNSVKYKTIAAGSATSVWAATAPALEGKGPLYLEDCQVAPMIDTANMTYGVLPHALDSVQADQLWAKAEEILGHALPLVPA